MTKPEEYIHPCQVQDILTVEGFAVPRSATGFWDKEDYCFIQYDWVHTALNNEPYDRSLYMYDQFVADNPEDKMWQVTLFVPVKGLYHTIAVFEYDDQAEKWNHITTGAINLNTWLAQFLSFRSVSAEWTPTTDKTYYILATMRRGFTESPFSLWYDYAPTDENDGQDSMMEMMEHLPDGMNDDRVSEVLKAMED